MYLITPISWFPFDKSFQIKQDYIAELPCELDSNADAAGYSLTWEEALNILEQLWTGWKF